MKKFSVAVVIGARPQFIKAAALSHAFNAGNFSKILELLWIHTGQHYDYELSDVFFEEFSLPKPKYHLKVGSSSHACQTADILTRIEKVYLKEKPHLVLVVGDTNSTFSGALAAAKLNIPIAHVEAGLRSSDRRMPEEINRVLTDHLSALLFCPTRNAVDRLASEGIKKGVFLTGDVMADVFRKQGAGRSKICNIGRYYLATIHRNTNTDNFARLFLIMRALSKLDYRVIFPLHPRTKKAMEGNPRLRSMLKTSTGNIEFCPPVSYFDMIELERRAWGIITDSGGVQKEAFLAGVPCVTLRSETEWTESVASGLNRLCEPDAKKILEAFIGIRKNMSRRKHAGLYGDGHSSDRILKQTVIYLRKHLQ